jgi:hypothetical protein
MFDAMAVSMRVSSSCCIIPLASSQPVVARLRVPYARCMSMQGGSNVNKAVEAWSYLCSPNL